MPVYDAESMNITAGSLDRLAEEFRSSKAKMKGVEGESPFGDVEDPENPDKVSGTLGSFTSGMQSEFETAAGLMTAASTALRDAVAAMGEADATAADNLTVREV
ncbi:hypothetical protein [Prauserella flavalba]|uniref:Uncharacterized protein n=1 Tax=Prauserella flavalba TaxID=1477506 RepID=A0A318LZW5_9PSEU|nr:hypothetical protein [Prauserella flavalba]PXY38338.1 hypothetical protein BA062_00825 [Prauserella flavalba]